MLMTTNTNVLIEKVILDNIHMEMVLTIIAMVVSGIKIVNQHNRSFNVHAPAPFKSQPMPLPVWLIYYCGWNETTIQRSHAKINYL